MPGKSLWRHLPGKLTANRVVTEHDNPAATKQPRTNTGNQAAEQDNYAQNQLYQFHHSPIINKE